LGDSNWFATESGDNTKAFIHVLTAPSSNTLTLPAPADGKIFTNATLLASLQIGAATQQVLNAAVTLLQTPRGLQLTLTGTNTWSALDTVIQLDVASQGGTGMVNDSSPNITYSGSSWSYQPHRGLGEFADDAHLATANGDSFTLTFSGTEVSLITSRVANRGGVDIYLDDVLQTNVNLSVGVTNRDIVFTKSGLPRGIHTLKGVKTGGTYLVVDAFRVIELVNDSDPDLSGSYPNTLSLGSGAAGYAGPQNLWQPGGSAGWITPGVTYDPSRSLTDTNPPVSDYFTFTFTGTGAQCFLSSAYSWAYFFLTVDGVFQTNVQVSQGNVSTFTVTNLPMGTHTLQGITWKATSDPSQPGVSYFTVTRPDMWIYQTNRNLGEYGNDVHYSDVNGPFNYSFTGSGVDVIVSRDENARMTWYGVSGMGTSTGARRQNYSESFQAGGSSFGLPNLVPGNYSVTAQNGANTSGMNFSYVRLNIDALRVYKGESLSTTPLIWGASGTGGSGTWDIATTANWNDGGMSSKWYDFGGLDYAAIFPGTAGTVSLAANINVNQLTFNTTGYTLQNNTLTLNGSSPTITTASNVNATVTSVIAGSAGLTKTGAGALVLNGANTYTGGTVINGGTISISGRSADNGGYTSLGSGAVTVNAGGTLVSADDWATGNEWNSGSVGKITLNGGTWTINAAGSTVRNGLELNSGVINGTGVNGDWGGLYLRNTSVTVGGNASSSIAVDTALNANTSITVSSGSQLNYSGNIHNTIGTTGGITKTGAGALRLNGTNIYTGATIVSEGTLGGTGSVKGSVTVQSGAVLSPGASIGTLSISNTLTLSVGSQTVMEINAASGANDLVRGITTVNYGGTLVVSNVTGALSAGQTFQLFSAANRTGNFSAISPVSPAPGLAWSFNPTNGVLTALATVALNPTNFIANLNGMNLTLTWPADHIGWTLTMQTNNLNLGLNLNPTNWMRLTNTMTTNQFVIPLNGSTPAGFFRLVYP
jgi:autotransporter-associated beta strand protein